MEYKNSGKARIFQNKIVIEVAIPALPTIVEGQWAAGYSEVRYVVTDPKEFATWLVAELNRESEDGTTPIHLLFDKCILEAIEQGAFGIDEHEEQEK